MQTRRCDAGHSGSSRRDAAVFDPLCMTSEDLAKMMDMKKIMEMTSHAHGG